MGNSLESSRPILADNSRRFSMYSIPSNAPSIAPSDTSRTERLIELRDGLARLESKKMMEQRYVVSDEKREMINKLALTAKLERALRWRMSNQEATLRAKTKAKHG